MTNRNMIYLDYNMISMKLDSMIDTIRKRNYTAIVAIVRGGLFPASHVSVRTGLPIYYLRYDRKNGNKIGWIGERPNQGKVLLIEDLAGSGRTLLDCREYLNAQGYEHEALVIWKDAISASTPELICFQTNKPSESFIVPWEKSCKINPRANNPFGESLQDHELEFTGWDMDGIFLDDVPSETYKVSLEQALILRDHYPLAAIQPNLEEKDVIITGRPTIDQERTLIWLGKQKIHHPLFLRDDGLEKPTAYTTALWKGKKALEVGCTRYVESDSEQAMYIASNYPQLEVVWWNRGEPIVIQAVSFSQAIS